MILAIVRRSDSEVTHATEQPQGAVAVDEGQHAPAEPTPAPAHGLHSMTESLPSALEPELRRIIDTAVARVAAIELEAIREARELTQRSEEEARQALSFALDRAFNLINTLELLAATVGGMAEALKIELDDAIGALRNVPQPQSELAKELANRQPAPAPALEAAAQPEPAAQPAPAAEPEPVAQAQQQPEPVAPPETAVAEEPAPEAPAPQPQPVAEAAPAEAQPEVEAPESVRLDAVKPQEVEKVAEDTAAEEVAVSASRSNGYPPAERQAESLAATSNSDSAEERAKTVMHTPSSSDGKPAVPTRRRGLMRRLFG